MLNLRVSRLLSQVSSFSSAFLTYLTEHSLWNTPLFLPYDALQIYCATVTATNNVDKTWHKEKCHGKAPNYAECTFSNF